MGLESRRRPLAAFVGLAAAVAFVGAPGAASDQQPIYILGGLDYLNASGRALTDGRGLYGGFGYISGDQGILGTAGIDLDWRHNERALNRIDSLAFSYSERNFEYFKPVYFGFGVGSTYNRVERHEDGHEGTQKHWRLGAKGIVGATLGYGFVVEGAYFYSGHDNGVDTSGMVAALGFWF
jgi:hypothetical protein